MPEFSKIHIIGAVIILLIIGFVVYKFISNRRASKAISNVPVTSSDLKVATIIDDESLYDDASQIVLNSKNLKKHIEKPTDNSSNIDRIRQPKSAKPDKPSKSDKPSKLARPATPIPSPVPSPVPIEEIHPTRESDVDTFEETLKFIKDIENQDQHQSNDDDLFDLDEPLKSEPVSSRINIKLKK